MENKRNSFTDIYSNYYPIVFISIYTKVSNREDARDICQEVFLRLYERFDKVVNIRKWLFNALKLVVLEHYRKSRNNESLNIDDVFQDISLTFVNGFRDSRILINEVIEHEDNFKDENERILFDLIAKNNFTYDHVAKQLGMTRRQVEYRYKLIVEKILNYFNNKGIKSIEDLL